MNALAGKLLYVRSPTLVNCLAAAGCDNCASLWKRIADHSNDYFLGVRLRRFASASRWSSMISEEETRRCN
ncbi:unnamed protein product [Amoebophrya sp. A25]|nr:unnamed protein product [Amoebophrya sp. A25]|eukprot:GSA25T00003729001.1